MEDLISELRDGVTPLGIHDDNSTELFDVDGANEKMLEAAEAITTLTTENAALAARVEALEGALKPFADCCEYIRDDEDDVEWAKFRLIIKDYRRARAALAGDPS